MDRHATGYPRDMIDAAASGLNTISDAFSDIHRGVRARAHERSHASTSSQNYQAWNEKVGEIINSLYDHAPQDLNINLENLNQLDDATVCLDCMQKDRRHRYYISSMSTLFSCLLTQVMLSRR